MNNQQLVPMQSFFISLLFLTYYTIEPNTLTIQFNF